MSSIGSSANIQRSSARLEVVATQSNADPSGKAGKIAAEMERRLMIGDFHFGETLSTTQLARQFDASRQPVSAAIAHLRSSGYVEVIPQVGCKVVSPSAAEIGDFFVALGKIEASAASFAARRYEQPEEADDLVAIAENDGLGELASPAERQAYIDSLQSYHDRVWLMARSPALAGRVAAMRRLAIFYLWQGSSRLTLTSASLLVMERIEIAQAIKARDAMRAEILMDKHISHKPFVTGVL